LQAALAKSAATVANTVKPSKRAPFISTFLFSSGEEGDTTYGLLAAASAATQKPSPTPLHVRGAALRAGLFGAVTPKMQI